MTDKEDVIMDQDYLPFGGDLPRVGQTEVLNDAGERHKYTGQKEVVSIGPYYYGARYYDPSIGRFITEDTYPGELAKPQSQNLYVYVMNNPLRYVDPTGNKVEEENPQTKKIDLAKIIKKIIDFFTNKPLFDSDEEKLKQIDLKTGQEIAKHNNTDITGQTSFEDLTAYAYYDEEIQALMDPDQYMLFKQLDVLFIGEFDENIDDSIIIISNNGNLNAMDYGKIVIGEIVDRTGKYIGDRKVKRVSYRIIGFDKEKGDIVGSVVDEIDQFGNYSNVIKHAGTGFELIMYSKNVVDIVQHPELTTKQKIHKGLIETATTAVDFGGGLAVDFISPFTGPAAPYFVFTGNILVSVGVEDWKKDYYKKHNLE